jgi:hypothetical protein
VARVVVLIVKILCGTVGRRSPTLMMALGGKLGGTIGRSCETVRGPVRRRLQMVALIVGGVERPVQDRSSGSHGGDDVADVGGGTSRTDASRERVARLQGEDDRPHDRHREHLRHLVEDILGQLELDYEGPALGALAGERRRRVSRHALALW